MKLTLKSVKRDIVNQLGKNQVAIISSKVKQGETQLLLSILYDMSIYDECLYLATQKFTKNVASTFLSLATNISESKWEEADFNYANLEPNLRNRARVQEYLKSKRKVIHFKDCCVSPKALEAYLTLHKPKKGNLTVVLDDVDGLINEHVDQAILLSRSERAEDLLVHFAKEYNCKIIAIKRLGQDSKEKLRLDIYK